MSPKTSQPKKANKKTSAKGRRTAFQLTRKELFLWLGVAFLALVWMFTLGVIVGRGLSPVRFDVEKLTKELIAFKEEALKREETARHRNMEPASDKRNLGFYDILTDKKEEARAKSLLEPRKRPPKPPTTSEVPRKLAPKMQKKPSVSKEKKQAASLLAGKASSGKSFTLQVASLKNLTEAKNLVSVLKKKGYGAYAATAHVAGKGTYHRVRVGHFKDRKDATDTAARLRREKLEPLVLRE